MKDPRDSHDIDIVVSCIDRKDYSASAVESAVSRYATALWHTIMAFVLGYYFKRDG